VHRTAGSLRGPLGSEPSVCAECLFADPIADIAILGSPDNQALFEEAKAYEALVESAQPFTIADAPEEGPGWLLSLDGKWFGCTVGYIKHVDGPLYISNTQQPIADGMSGSPVISDDGAAIGIVALGSSTPLASSSGCENHYGSPNPRLIRDLPGWLLRGCSQ
jgi:hypothetical protein